MNVEIELQKALFLALSSPAYKVKDGWYAEESLPLINIGDMEVEDGQSKVNDDWYVNVSVHSWSMGKGSTEIKNMNHHIRQGLDNVTIPGYRVTGRLIRTSTLKEMQQQDTRAVEKTLYHGVTFYRFYILKEELAHG